MTEHRHEWVIPDSRAAQAVCADDTCHEKLGALRIAAMLNAAECLTVEDALSMSEHYKHIGCDYQAHMMLAYADLRK